MKNLAACLVVLVLGGCGTNYQITKECFNENPLPSSMQVGQFFGLIGIGISYATDGSAISQVNQNRGACIDQKKAALAAANAPVATSLAP